MHLAVLLCPSLAVQIFNVDLRNNAGQRVVASKGQPPVAVDFHAIPVGMASQRFCPLSNPEAGLDVAQAGSRVQVN